MANDEYDPPERDRSGCIILLVLGTFLAIVGGVFVFAVVSFREERQAQIEAEAEIAELAKKQAFKRYAVTPVPILPAPLAGDRVVVQLPGKVRDACVGGGGRFLFLKIASREQLEVFDANEAKLVRVLPLATAATFAAGMNKLVVLDPDQRTITRYDLPSFRMETIGKMSLPGRVRHVCMGHASNGPLLASYVPDADANVAATTFLDPMTFREMDVVLSSERLLDAPANRGTQARASPDGRVFCVWSPDGSNTFRALDVAAGRAREYAITDGTRRQFVPADDGTLFSWSARHLLDFHRIETIASGSSFPIPATTGGVFVEPFLSRTSDVNRNRLNPQYVTLRPRAGNGPLETITDFDFVLDRGQARELPPDKWFQYVPAAKLLIAVAESGDKLLLRRADPEKALKDADVGYLYVDSLPPRAVAGRPYEYRIEARSVVGGATCKLVSGPPGLTVSTTGLVAWAAPADAGAPVRVTVEIADDSTRKIVYLFQIIPGPAEDLVPLPSPP